MTVILTANAQFDANFTPESLQALVEAFDNVLGSSTAISQIAQLTDSKRPVPEAESAWGANPSNLIDLPVPQHTVACPTWPAFQFTAETANPPPPPMLFLTEDLYDLHMSREGISDDKQACFAAILDCACDDNSASAAEFSSCVKQEQTACGGDIVCDTCVDTCARTTFTSDSFDQCLRNKCVASCGQDIDFCSLNPSLTLVPALRRRRDLQDFPDTIEGIAFYPSECLKCMIGALCDDLNGDARTIYEDISTWKLDPTDETSWNPKCDDVCGGTTDCQDCAAEQVGMGLANDFEFDNALFGSTELFTLSCVNECYIPYQTAMCVFEGSPWADYDWIWDGSPDMTCGLCIAQCACGGFSVDNCIDTCKSPDAYTAFYGFVPAPGEIISAPCAADDEYCDDIIKHCEDKSINEFAVEFGEAGSQVGAGGRRRDLQDFQGLYDAFWGCIDDTPDSTTVCDLTDVSGLRRNLEEKMVRSFEKNMTTVPQQGSTQDEQVPAERRSLSDINTFEYVCYDSLTSLTSLTGSDFNQCSRIGRWLQRPDIIDTLISDRALTPVTPSFEWSDTLAHSAKMFMDEMGGCPAMPDQVIDFGSQTEYIEQVATFTNFHRIVAFPQRFKWASVTEMVFDVLLDDYNMQTPNRYALLNGEFNQMGVVCGCHPTFEYYCVIELGRNVHNTTHIPEVEQADLSQPGQCDKSFESKYCQDYKWHGDRDRVRQDHDAGTTTLETNAWHLFDTINELRRDSPLESQKSYASFFGRPARKARSKWPAVDRKSFIWSEALSLAGRHVLNEQGACNTHGSFYGESFKEALDRYYAHDYSDLEVVELTSPNLAGLFNHLVGGDSSIDNTKAGYTGLNWIMTQDWIDKGIFADPRALHLGISCACAQSAGNLPQYTCIFAFARNINGRNIKERVPKWQKALALGQSCSERCEFNPIIDPTGDDGDEQDYLPHFVTNPKDCGEGEFVSYNGYCVTCADLTYKCTECTEEQFGEYNGQCQMCGDGESTWSAAIADWDLDSREYSKQICAVKNCGEYEAGFDKCSSCDGGFQDPETGECVDACSDILSATGSTFVLYAGACTCTGGPLAMNPDGSCKDCSAFSDDCVGCTETDCIACSGGIVSPDGNECWDYYTNCEGAANLVIDQPSNLQTGTVTLEDGTQMGTYSCPCIEGYAQNFNDFMRCDKCEKIIDHCLDCASALKCNQCEPGYTPSFNGMSCQLEIEFCQVTPNDYVSNGEIWVCPDCVDGYFSYEGGCEKCSPMCLTCDEFSKCNECAGGLAWKDETCIEFIEDCEVPPEYYDWNAEYEVYTCPKCSDNKVFIPEARGCLTCGESIFGCIDCSEGLTHCNECERPLYESPNKEFCMLEPVDPTCAQSETWEWARINDTAWGCTDCGFSQWLKIDDYSCHSCRDVITDCIECSDGENCLQCAQGLMVNYLGTECVSNINHCKGAPLESQPLGLVQRGDDERWICSECDDYYGWVYDVFQCLQCNTDKCINCDGQDICLKCEAGYFPSIDQRSCVPAFDSCPRVPFEDQPENLIIHPITNEYVCPFCSELTDPVVLEFFDIETYTCQKCADIDHCLSCDNDGCQICESGFKASGKYCLASDIEGCLSNNVNFPDQCDICFPNHELSLDKRTCMNCQGDQGVQGCAVCTLDSFNQFNECRHCSQGLKLIDGECNIPGCGKLREIPDTIYTVTFECEACAEGFSWDETSKTCVCCEPSDQWLGCDKCSLNGLIPTECLSCKPGMKQVQVNGQTPSLQCHFELPDNCLLLEDDSPDCLKCAPGYFLWNGECSDCKVEGCEQCRPFFNPLTEELYGECERCMHPFETRYVLDDMQMRESRMICDFVEHERKPHCKWSDLSDREKCHLCDEGYFWSADEWACVSCGHNESHCTECNPLNGACSDCDEFWQIKFDEPVCWQPHCAVWSDDPTVCDQCVNGWFLEHDTGLCVEECDRDNYEVDYLEGVCMAKCISGQNYNDREDYSHCFKCDEGPHALENCKLCSSDDQGRTAKCDECDSPFRPNSDGICEHLHCLEFFSETHCTKCAPGSF